MMFRTLILTKLKRKTKMNN